MKVLLKKEVCGSYEQYIKLTGKAKKGQCTFKKKKKKKKERQNADSGSVSAVPKWVLSVHLSQFGHQPMYPFLQSFRNSSHPQKQCPVSFFTSVFIVPHNKPSHLMLWGPIDPIGTIHLEKGWAYGPIPSPRIRAYLRTIS